MNVANMSQGNGATSCCARRLRTLKIKCPECKKKYEVRIASAAERVKCPLCGKEEELVNISKSIKEPMGLQVVHIVMYTIAVLFLSVLIMMVIESASEPNDILFGSFMVSVVLLVLFIGLFVSMGAFLNRGYGWPRFVLLFSICAGIFNCCKKAIPNIIAGSDSYVMIGKVSELVGITAIYLALLMSMFTSAARDWLSVKKEIRRIEKTRKVNAK